MKFYEIAHHKEGVYKGASSTDSPPHRSLLPHTSIFALVLHLLTYISVISMSCVKCSSLPCDCFSTPCGMLTLSTILMPTLITILDLVIGHLLCINCVEACSFSDQGLDCFSCPTCRVVFTGDQFRPIHLDVERQIMETMADKFTIAALEAQVAALQDTLARQEAAASTLRVQNTSLYEHLKGGLPAIPRLPGGSNYDPKQCERQLVMDQLYLGSRVHEFLLKNGNPGATH